VAQNEGIEVVPRRLGLDDGVLFECICPSSSAVKTLCGCVWFCGGIAWFGGKPPLGGFLAAVRKSREKSVPGTVALIGFLAETRDSSAIGGILFRPWILAGGLMARDGGGSFYF